MAKKPTKRGAEAAESVVTEAALSRMPAYILMPTEDPNVFIRLDWDPVERRYHLNPRVVRREDLPARLAAEATRFANAMASHG